MEEQLNQLKMCINFTQFHHLLTSNKIFNLPNRSATAKLTESEERKVRRVDFEIQLNPFLPMKKFVTLLSLWEQKTAAITKQLPTMTRISIKPSTANDIKFFGSVHCTESISCAHSVSFISFA
jgi:hypothetical protein